MLYFWKRAPLPPLLPCRKRQGGQLPPLPHRFRRPCPKLVFFTNIPFPAQNTSLQNCFPSLGSFLSPWTVYPDFDSCYSHFMPYRMTPSVRHRAIEVYYYYYVLLFSQLNQPTNALFATRLQHMLLLPVAQHCCVNRVLAACPMTWNKLTWIR